jgi:hypothetical protein
MEIICEKRGILGNLLYICSVKAANKRAESDARISYPEHEQARPQVKSENILPHGSSPSLVANSEPQGLEKTFKTKTIL